MGGVCPPECTRVSRKGFIVSAVPRHSPDPFPLSVDEVNRKGFIVSALPRHSPDPFPLLWDMKAP